jgi:hypothetical protein
MSFNRLINIINSQKESISITPVNLAENILSLLPEIKNKCLSIKKPYGRYLIEQNHNINCQLHIHSPNYQGLIHDHSTWGIMIPILGSFTLEDWRIDEINPPVMIRKYVISNECYAHFPNLFGYDWHKNTNRENSNSISLHIYGPNYNNDYGRHFNERDKTITLQKRSLMLNLF